MTEIPRIVVLFGRVTKEGDVYVAEVHGVWWAAQGGSLENVLLKIPVVVRSYFDAYERANKLDLFLRELGIGDDENPDSLVIEVRLNASEIISELQLVESVPLSISHRCKEVNKTI